MQQTQFIIGLYKRNITVEDSAITSAVHLTLRQSLLPNALVTILFFLWGFAYGLLDTLNSHFQTTLNISATESSRLQASYFAAYFICPQTISGWIVRKYGFQVTFMTGLAVLAVGCLLFWPSGAKRSFGGFCGSNVVGAGLSTLETEADPFLAICGSWNLRCSPLGLRVFFANTVDTHAGWKNVQLTHLGVACFVSLLVILFWLAPFPEITDADQEALESQIVEGNQNTGPFKKQYSLLLGVWSQFYYVGAQVAVAGYFINFCKETGKTSAESSDLLAVAQGLYAFMRFVCSGLMMMPAFKPRYMLTVFLALCFVFTVAAMTTHGHTSIAMLILVLCFESVLLLRYYLHLGSSWPWSPHQAWWIHARGSLSGGMVFPPMTGAVVTRVNAHTAMAIPVMGYILALIFPNYVNIYKKESMDLHRNTEINVKGPSAKELELEEGNYGKPTAANVETIEPQETERS
ncbi:uncharacterized protein N7473_008218 [Penicillium subrubescens]|uniref:uncharacterized protein n=1 Tax=Penicillium subrubescens TaxID=1316194 RepID=UPI0025451BCC|nr:uncharacterized protein N7473_008218 [Penicillium subrubescens]KAJ5891990.1 hypothetical protein N7473_008218 [Penicillium subrubescens]